MRIREFRSLIGTMTEEPREVLTEESAEVGHALPFPYNQQNFCRYEPIEKQIDQVRVLVVDSLLRDEDDISDVARSEWGSAAALEIRRERKIATMAMENIVSNVDRLVKQPVHPHNRLSFSGALGGKVKTGCHRH